MALAKNMCDHLSDLHLAEVDILIGSDQYWRLVTREVRRGDGGLMATHRRLGWVLSGPVEDSTCDSAMGVVVHVFKA